MWRFTSMAAVCLLVLVLVCGYAFGSKLAIEISDLKIELLDLRSDLVHLHKNIEDVRRDLYQERLDKDKIFGQMNETIYRWTLEGTSRDQDSDHWNIHNFQCFQKGLAKEKSFRIKIEKNVDAIDSRVTKSLTQLARKIQDLETQIGSSLLEKIEERLGTVERKYNQSLSELRETLSSLSEVRSCDDGWIQGQGSRYFFSKKKESWDSAMQSCKELKSYLLRIDNDAEFRFVRGNLNLKNPEEDKYQDFLGSDDDKNYWVGGNDVIREGNWVWLPSNSPMRYTAWARGEPNNQRNVEDCAELRERFNYYMNDASCDIKSFFICETDC